MRSLAADSFRGSAAALLGATAILGAWLAWFVFAPIAIYETTDSARLEVDRTAHPIEAPLEGRIVAIHASLGLAVHAGDPIADLDSNPQRLELEEKRRHLSSLELQIEALEAEMAARKRSLSEAREAGFLALEEAQARFREAEVGARLAEEEATRLANLHQSGTLAEIELLRARAEAQKRGAASETLRLAASRQELDLRAQESDRGARLEELSRERTRLEGEKAMAVAAAERLLYEIERRSVRAPISGRLGDMAVLGVGAFVKEGDRLGAVVPPGELRVVADFLPHAALGRIREDQPARLRFAGFPWTQYGTVAARVTRVANETRAGRVRVELALLPDPACAIPLEHGLPATAEVQVERISPAALVLRAAGQRLGATGPVSAAAAGAGGSAR
jgi:multidrug resistance efflux pump